MPRARPKASSSLAKVAASQGGDGARSPSFSRRMRRTALRDSFNSRLISRRLWPCALRSFTPLRVSIGIILAIPFDVLLQSFEVSLGAAERLHQLWRERGEHPQALAHAADQLVDPPQVRFALALWANTQALDRRLCGTLPQCFQEQARVIKHPLANAALCFLVMLEPYTQLSGGE